MLDLRGFACPLPRLMIKRKLSEVNELYAITNDNSLFLDLSLYAESNGFDFSVNDKDKNKIIFHFKRMRHCDNME